MDHHDLFNQLIEKYTSPLYKRAYYLLSDKEEAEDIVQEVFIATFKALDNIKDKSNQKSWLFGILNHKVADYYRKKYKETNQISLDHYFDEEGSWKKEQILYLNNWNNTADNLFDDEIFQYIFKNCVNKLPEKWRIPIKMYYLEEKKSKELSQELNITATNIWKILQRGRLHLKECLETNWLNK